jgi:hypothetical protein
MAEGDSELVVKFRSLSVLLEMTEDAIVVAKKGLLKNPEKEERRELDENILELTAKRAKITNTMIAIASNAAAMPLPPPELVKQIARLADKVDEMSRANVVASAAVKTTGQVLDVVTDALA